MKYVQINSFHNGSTGTIMKSLHQQLTNEGHTSYIFWGRRHETINDHEQCFASKIGVYSHGLRARLTDRTGFYSKRDTARLLKRLDEINPDVVHLHNIHGYYINIEMLFYWLAAHDCQVKWTLHDCWAITGHCSYFTYANCEQWRTHCSHCPQKKEYPKSLFLDASVRNYGDKKRIFNLVPSERMTIITPSRWLADLVEQSFLSNYSVEVVRNTINTSVFKPTPSDFRKKYGIGDRFMILGVASPWTERKGLKDFLRLAGDLDCEKYAITLVGLSERQRRQLPCNLIALPRIERAEELAEVYSAADVFIHPGVEETFGLTVAEAQSCGTHAVVVKGSACAEIADKSAATFVSAELDALESVVVELAERGRASSVS